MLTNEPDIQEPADISMPNWGGGAPRGGMAVMNRILKDKATVPLFFAQTLIQSLRDVGYNHTTSALCEHIDNAIQAGATEIRVFFRQTGKKGSYSIDVAVYDNGSGMPPNILKVAMAFGGSMNFDNREGIARFGMGMKTAALSIAPTFELYSWQERSAIYSMVLDVEEIGKERSNLVQLPDPTLLSELPDEIADFFRKPMSWPDAQDQELFSLKEEGLPDRFGPSGTIVYMPQCDRLTYAQARTLVEHAVKEMSRVYRRAIADGLQLFVNNRRVDAFDPMYAMPNARHSRFLSECPVKTSRLVVPKTVSIRCSEFAPELGSSSISIKIFKLPIDEWYHLPRKTLKNDLRVFDGLTVSILRNGRELFAGAMPKLTTRHSVTHWYRIQIEFTGALDEAFGVAANKQGVRLKGYVEKAIKETIGDDITTINEEIKRFQAEQSELRRPAKPTASEAKANEADPFQMKGLAILSAEEEAQFEANLRGLAITLKRPNETDEQAFERIKNSRYVIAFRHDEYWPFYDVKHTFGRVILTINTAHPFYAKLYEPLRKLEAPEESEGGDDTETNATPAEAKDGPAMALDLLLLSLARTQSRLSQASEEAQAILENLRREWSETYRVQLTV
jgi:hypothetical protein